MIRRPLLALLASAAIALEPPAGVGGFVDPPQAGVPYGGSLVAVAPGVAATLAEALPPGEGPWAVAFAGRRGLAHLRSRSTEDGGPVLLRLEGLDPAPVALGDDAALGVGIEVWSAANAIAAVVDDGMPAISRGTVSGRYRIPADAPALRGRGGRELSLWRGPVIETDAAINEGSPGGALLDGSGRLVGLLSLGGIRERRLGVAVPVSVLRTLLSQPAAVDAAPAPGTTLPDAVVAIRWERPGGLENPSSIERPSKRPDQVPASERDRVQSWWDAFFHQQQILRSDQALPAVVIGRRELLTAASNLFGEARQGRILLPGGTAIPVAVQAIDRALDIALLTSETDLPLTPLEPGVAPAIGEEIAVVGRHGAGPATRTAGVISATDRRRAQAPLGFLQIDALVNYGANGGALLDGRGRLAGLVVGIAPDAPWLINSGIALAVSAPLLRDALADLRAGKGRERMPLLGLGVQLNQDRGVLVVNAVIPGSGAAAAGLLKGDALLAVDGRPIASRDALARQLLRRKPGDTVRLGVRRQGKQIEVPVTLSVIAP